MTYNKCICLGISLLFGTALAAQEGRVPVHVSPHEAYVFLDGTAVRDGRTTLKTTPGEHTIAVYNYGYQAEVRKVSVQAGKNEVQTFDLKKAGADVSSPYGYIQIEGPGRAAVLLNGTSPEYLVGHVDEFNNHIIWKQQLIVPAGTHHVTVVRNGKTLYSNSIDVAQGDRVIVNVKKNTTRVQHVDSGTDVTRPRFKAGIASAAVTIAPVSGSFAANPPRIDCNETAQLAYASKETLHSSIKDEGGEKKLTEQAGQVPESPRHTTTYHFEASGPGGVVSHDATVNVNPAIKSSLETSQPEVHYLKVGDKVLTQGSTDLKWTVNNADKISIDPVGSVPATAPGTSTGQKTVTPEPKPASGTLDETQTYTLTASNVCGGSDTKTAQVRIKGMTEPYILSVFFPTGYPTLSKEEEGLVPSQRDTLVKIAKAFTIYSEHTPEAKLVIRGNTDPRGTDIDNMKLSERRVEAVRAFLVSQGVPEGKIVTKALGETKQLNSEEVKRLEAENPFRVSAPQQDERTTELAYNRRIDLELQPVNVETARFFPYEVADAELLLNPAEPSRKAEIVASKRMTSSRSEQATPPAEMAKKQADTQLPQTATALPSIAAMAIFFGLAAIVLRRFV